MDLAGRWAINEIEGKDGGDLDAYGNPESDKHREMVSRICKRLKLTTLRYQRLDDLIESIGLPAEKLCTFCWNGVG